MGGRGAGLNVNNYLGWSHERRIGEYDAIQVDGNIKFLMQKDGGRTAAPIFSNTEGRIYVTIRPDGTIAGITQYDSNHKQLFSINEPHAGDKIQDVHMHSSLDTGRQVTHWDKMPQKYKDLYNTVKRQYKEFDIENKAKEYNKKHGR